MGNNFIFGNRQVRHRKPKSRSRLIAYQAKERATKQIRYAKQIRALKQWNEKHRRDYKKLKEDASDNQYKYTPKGKKRDKYAKYGTFDKPGKTIRTIAERERKKVMSKSLQSQLGARKGKAKKANSWSLKSRTSYDSWFGLGGF